MKKTYLFGALLASACLWPVAASAQLSSNPDKFLGNITTSGQVNGGGIEFITLWNQMTPENESKWSSIEGSRGNFNWNGCDNCYNYCREHDIPFKFHTLIWGSQYPGWMDNLNTQTQYAEIVKWMDAIKKRYPDLDMIDVVNEAVPGHAPAPYKSALGGDGVTGYDWIIKAFEMAHERWPDAILIYNDFNTFQWQKTEFINLVKTIRDAGAPIDAYGCQSHDLTDISFSTFKSAMTEIQSELKMPMYSSEYDIGTSDDQKQLRQYRDQIPYMWEANYVAGITLWGYIYGRTWTTDGNSGIIKNGVDRPAMTWLREYMASDKANAAKSPFPGNKKEASIYIQPAKKLANVNNELQVNINARLRTRTIDHIDFYVDNRFHSTLTEAPYTVTLLPEKKGSMKFRAVVYDTTGQHWERIGGVKVVGERHPFYETPIDLPGILEAEDFDKGGEGLTFHDTDSKNEGGVNYRDDNEGVDIGNGNGGYVIGYTAQGEWLEYTVNLTKAGKYTFEATVSSGNDGSSFSLSLCEDGVYEDISDVIAVPNGGSWDTYTTVSGKFNRRMTKGEKIIRVNITGGYVNLDKIEFKCGASGIEDILGEQPGEYDVYSLAGLYMGRMTVLPDDEISSKLYDLTGQQGIFIVRNTLTGQTEKYVSANR